MTFDEVLPFRTYGNDDGFLKLESAIAPRPPPPPRERLQGVWKDIPAAGEQGRGSSSSSQMATALMHRTSLSRGELSEAVATSQPYLRLYRTSSEMTDAWFRCLRGLWRQPSFAGAIPQVGSGLCLCPALLAQCQKVASAQGAALARYRNSRGTPLPFGSQPARSSAKHVSEGAFAVRRVLPTVPAIWVAAFAQAPWRQAACSAQPKWPSFGSWKEPFMYGLAHPRSDMEHSALGRLRQREPCR